MAQIFKPSFDLVFRLGVLGLVLSIVTLSLLWGVTMNAATNPEGTPIEQPVPFSHEHHVSDDGIDCRYCHASVERASFAGVPSTEVCMTCHSQLYTDASVLRRVRASFRNNTPIRWNRVHDLPDFVYFNHSIHVHKGIGCVSCHGRVDRMPLTWRAEPLTMEWCLDCHTDPAQHVRPRRHVFDMDWNPPENQLALGKRLARRYHIQAPRQLTDCSTCHR